MEGLARSITERLVHVTGGIEDTRDARERIGNAAKRVVLPRSRNR
jgi:hypothetical protein